MSETDTNSTSSTDSTTTATPPANAPADKTVEFDGPFDEERAKRRIAAMADDKAKLQARLAEFEKKEKEREDAEKSDLQKALERAEAAEKRIAAREAADEHRKLVKAALKDANLSDDDAAFLTGSTAEELAASAKALAARLGVTKESKDKETTTRRPQPKLTPGHETNDSDGLGDLDALVDRIRARQL